MFCCSRDEKSGAFLLPCIERDDKNVIRESCNEDKEEDAKFFITAEPLPDTNGVDAPICNEIDKTGEGLSKHQEDSCFDIVKMIGKFGLKCGLKAVLGCTTVILTCLPEPEQPDPKSLTNQDEATIDRKVPAIEVAAVESGEATVTGDASDVLATEATIGEAQAVSAEDQQLDASKDQQPDVSLEEPTADIAATENQQPDASKEEPGVDTATNADQPPDASKEEPGVDTATNVDQPPDASKESPSADVAANVIVACSSRRGAVVEERGDQQKGRALLLTSVFSLSTLPT